MNNIKIICTCPYGELFIRHEPIVSYELCGNTISSSLHAITVRVLALCSLIYQGFGFMYFNSNIFFGASWYKMIIVFSLGYQIHGKTELVTSTKRPVPLIWHFSLKNSLYPLLDEKGKKMNRYFLFIFLSLFGTLNDA